MTAAALALGLTACMPELKPLSATITPADYVAGSEGRATLVPAGKLTLDGKAARCGNFPTVLDPDLYDYAIAYADFMVINPGAMKKIGTSVKLWIVSHECAHLEGEQDEGKADCAGVQRGRREGWLTPRALDQICDFIRPGRPSARHFSGPQRCEQMRACFAEPLPADRTSAPLRDARADH